jgi:acetyl-CoA carboxylase carboxyl transferase subunit beta
VLVQDFAFRGGSMGTAAGEGFVAAADEAVKRGVPFVVFTATGGMRMEEGMLSLMQMCRTTVAVQRLRAAGLPYVVVMTDPTTAGVLASFGMLGDVQLAEPGATVGFAGRRVIERTIRETLPAGFQTSEFQVERGMVDRVVIRKELPAVLGSILRTLLSGRTRLSAA